jgi:dihydrodipicolinate synthase/N-acetylneuraminate lyase
MIDLPRSMPALVTPMRPDGSIDEDAHSENVKTMRDRGARGVVLAGSTGEGPHLEPGERARLVRGARDADSDMVVVCGIHAEATAAALRLADECADADVVLVVTPTALVRGRDDAVEGFYTDVADASPLPVLLYSVPSVTGWALPIASVRSLAAHPRIIGIKDSGGDPSRLTELHDVIEDGFTVYAGASRALAESSRLGAWGAITASANYALSYVSLAARGDGQAQHRLTALARVVERHGVAATKYAAERTGLTAGPARPPVLPLSEQARRDVDSALVEAGITRSQ